MTAAKPVKLEPNGLVIIRMMMMMMMMTGSFIICSLVYAAAVADCDKHLTLTWTMVVLYSSREHTSAC